MPQLHAHMDKINEILEQGEGLAMGSISKLAHRFIIRAQEVYTQKGRERSRDLLSPNVSKGIEWDS